ncbi:hypothetical protein IW492_13660 [Enterococcus sp. BWB1-3]|uniref:hypothetical protein n=1 Tax=Enterococcus sp. BWB1-3 TaxID=2787713 RepID=UPI0019219A0E|nr:hypothetical protein [Enterococcus sp. BWB1-3]MBL1230278.1 hypothetical protein [Enterococcus sp. BWB1-3]
MLAKSSAFMNRKKHLYEVKSISRKENKIERDEEKAAEQENDSIDKQLNYEGSLVKGNIQEIEQLDVTLDGIHDDDN